MHRWPMRLARSLVVLAVAGACWAAFVRDEHVDKARMATLVVRQPQLRGVQQRPAQATSLGAPTSPAPVARAAKRQPALTGAYQIGWRSAASAHTQLSAGLLVELVPSAPLARSVVASARKQYGATRTVQGETYALTSHFAVPGVGGAQGAGYTVKASGKAVGSAEVVTFVVDHVAVLQVVQSTGPVSRAQVVAMARAEAARLREVAPGFSLTVTTRPVGWSIGLGAGALVVAAAAAVLPEWIAGRQQRRARRHQQQRRDRVADEMRAGGRRAVRRHRPPAWQRQQRRARSRIGW